MDERIHLVSLTKRQLDIIFFALTEDFVNEEYEENEVMQLIDVFSYELNFTYESI